MLFQIPYQYLVILIVLLGAGSGFARADEFEPVYATVSLDKANIRAGSGENFEIIGQLNKGNNIVVTGEKFGWYKVKLPKEALCFVHKDYIEKGRVQVNRLRVRAGRGVNFNVLGMLKKGESVDILEEEGDWLRIVPAENCQGWVKKDLLVLSQRKFTPETVKSPPQTVKPPPPQKIEKKVEAMGIIDDLGKIFNRAGTHKLVKDKKILFYLKSANIDLNLYVYQNVYVKGKPLDLKDSPYPVIEVERVKIKK